MMKALSNKVARSYHCFRSFKRDFKNSEVPTLNPSKFVDQFRPPNYEYTVL